MSPNSGYNMNSKQNYEDHIPRTDYSMPGILHFLQTEWAKFEMERAQWDVEKAELQVRISHPYVYLNLNRACPILAVAFI